MKKIVITGGSGLMGTNAVTYFVNKGFSVLNFDRRPPQNKEQSDYWVKGDINDLEFYQKTVNDFAPDLFLHLAARTDLLEEHDLVEGYKTNILGVENTIQVINESETITRCLFASSRLVCKVDYIPKNYDDYCPPNLYGESKVMGEKIVKTSTINKEWMIFRPTSIWGPWFDSPYIIFFRTIQKNLYFHPGRYLPKKSFGYVRNSIYQLDKLFHAPTESIQGKTLYLCDYPPIDVKQWAELIRKELKSKRIPTYSMPLLKLFSKIGDVFYKFGWKRVPLTTNRLNNLVADMVFDTSELEAICGTLPYSLEQGVVETVDWMKNNRNRDKLSMVRKENE